MNVDSDSRAGRTTDAPPMSLGRQRQPRAPPARNPGVSRLTDLTHACRLKTLTGNARLVRGSQRVGLAAQLGPTQPERSAHSGCLTFRGIWLGGRGRRHERERT